MRKRVVEALRNLRTRRYVEAYAIAVVAAVLAALSLVNDVVSDNVRWAAVLAGVGVLVYRVTLPEDTIKVAADDWLFDRSRFHSVSFASRLMKAKQVWVLAPSAANVLSASNSEAIRRTVLRHNDGRLRVIVLNPDEAGAVVLAGRQLDDSVEFPAEEFEPALRSTIRRLAALAAWDTSGTVEWRLASYNPGFSLVGIDVPTQAGVIIVEFHGCHNVSTENRMHIEITRKTGGRWYAYWQRQFEEFWKQANAPGIVSVESGGQR
ncbi:hypothetical protein [Amycolatopsis minnesotensis]|uniref:Uncharacterized protein n=1 Tax=Amycolatopsis minnesotensis TaxID=337894 RepID=A0ABN2PZ58_9PSEU